MQSLGPPQLRFSKPSGDPEINTRSLRTTNWFGCNTADPWTMLGSGHQNPTVKNPHVLLTPPELTSCPSVSVGDWFQDPQGYQNLQMLKSLRHNGADQGISRHSTSLDSQQWSKNTVFDPRLAESTDVKPRDTKGRLCTYWGWGGKKKKSACKWTCAVETHVVQGPTVLLFAHNWDFILQDLKFFNVTGNGEIKYVDKVCILPGRTEANHNVGNLKVAKDIRN